MTHEILDHPADVRFRANGATFEAVFSEVIEVVSELVGGEHETRPPTVTRELDLEARNLEALLFEFLNQLILLQDIEDAVVTHAERLEVEETADGYRLSGTVHAAPIPSESPLFEIKAPTDSQM
jgi:SHS2 domain-containing protein